MQLTGFQIIMCVFMIIVLLLLVRRNKKDALDNYIPPVPNPPQDGTPPIGTESKSEVNQDTPLNTDEAKPVLKDRPEGAVEKKEKYNWWRKFLFYLQLRDGFISIPVLFVMTQAIQYGLSFLFPTVGWYEPSFIVPLFTAANVLFGCGFFVQLFTYFYFRFGVHRFIWGKHRFDEKAVLNYSKEAFTKLDPKWQLLIAGGTFFFLLVFMLVVYVVSV